MKTIKLMNEFMHGVIWTEDEEGLLTSEIPIVANDKICQELNKKIGNLYNSYYEFDTHDEACWFNIEQFKKDKQKMLSLLNELLNRLKEINDGSFLIDDYEIHEIEKL